MIIPDQSPLQTDSVFPSLPLNSSTNLTLMQREMKLMRRERDLLAREVRLLQRQNQVQGHSITGSSNSLSSHSNVNIRDISDLLSEFSGSNRNFYQWEKQLQLLSATYKLNDNLAKILLSSKLRSNALEWFHSKSDHIEMSMEDLLKDMKQMFDHRPNRLERRRLFEERKWKFNEAFCEYYHKKLILANQVPVDDEEVVDYILDGMPDLQLRTQARMRCLKTSSELLEGFNKSSLQLQLTKVLFQESRCEY
ncbi:uncharacterized protein LOC117173458 isoform X1 [Belonocnema kinseyi]|uniref:uncharacterized protein LOC117173458 isoform X1 n=1 Tax=Belonocnema kinseyi TaxID=2817044 RepID=UPI00143D897C|nr:uncharacterized protein LOC117173458 isoform X1 [Belonocnema kinseyi]XP_033217932.1 uncharacterized protein LOC117173458 isoform X1 [Belonocnema kinseyi]